jgi:hypothetical protein
MKSGFIGVIVCSLVCYGCARETNIESSILESVPKWDAWTDVTKRLDEYCDEWDSMIVVGGPTIDNELAEILGVPIHGCLQDGEHGYYFFYESRIRKIVTTRETNGLTWSAEGNHVSVRKGDTVLVRRTDEANEAIVRRPTRQR